MSYEELMSEYQKMKSENADLLKIIANQQLELNTLKKVIFGQKREYTPKKEQLENVTQCSLFNDDQNVEKEIKEQVQEKTEEITVHKRKDSKKKTCII